MRILFGYGYNTEVLPVYLESAMRANHEVITCGTSVGRPQEIPCTPEASILDIWDYLPDSRKPDLFVWSDSLPVFFPRDVEKLPVPTVAWPQDSTAGRMRRPDYSLLFDRQFIANKFQVQTYSDLGDDSVGWLPAACDPDIHKPHDVEQVWDVCFLGTYMPGLYRSRGKYIERLLELAEKKNLKVYIGNGVYREDMARLYSQSRIVLHICMDRKAASVRVYEALSCKSFLLADYLPDGEIEGFFEDGKHLALFDETNFEEKILHYLAHPEERARIGETGHKEARAHHTYENRVNQILEAVSFKKKGDELIKHRERLREQRNVRSLDGVYGCAYYCQQLSSFAIPYYLNALTTDPLSAHLWYELGLAQAASGDRKLAVESLNKAISLNDRLLIAQSDLSEVLLELGMLEEARQVNQKIFHVLEGGDYEAELGPHYPHGWQWRRVEAVRMIHRGLSGEEFKKQFGEMVKTRAFLHLGQICLSEEDHDEAISYFSKAVSDSVDIDALYGQMADTYWKKGDIKEVIRCLEELRETYGIHINASLNLAHLYHQTGDFKRVLKEAGATLRFFSVLRSLRMSLPSEINDEALNLVKSATDRIFGGPQPTSAPVEV
ncbi:MAG: glycosyltransferase [Armatimonadetes bacterium]|nr:glycosyltransferase [Armatimonadota bacterium]